jgi:hypothetical protein
MVSSARQKNARNQLAALRVRKELIDQAIRSLEFIRKSRTNRHRKTN